MQNHDEADVPHDFDADHERLRVAVDRVTEAIRTGTPRDTSAIEQQLLATLEEARKHFAAEEALMERHGYPYRVTHIGSHHEFVGRANRVLETLRRAGPSRGLAAVFAGEMGMWLASHIKTTDAKFYRFLATLEDDDDE